MPSLSEKQAALKAEFARFRHPQDLLAHVARMARQRPALAEEFKTPENKLEGCLSNLWLVTEFQGGRCRFRADSDSAIVKGLAAVICELFDEQAPSEIVGADLAIFRETGLWGQLTPNRRTGLSRLMDRIQEFARAHDPALRRS